ncbi:MAG TPA: phosphotransferase family protein [Gemmatimonadales bacterium]|nr:phosphotransferase family protein [Gemmatimonadales bacterium]
MKPDEVHEGLARFIAGKTGASTVAIENLVRLSGGASRETWSFDAEWDAAGSHERLEGILRADPVPGLPSMPGRALEYHSIKAAWDAGVVVPEPMWDGDDTFPVKFFVMRRVPGEAIGSRLIRGDQYARAREDLPGQLARSMARIHTISVEQVPELAALPMPQPGASPAEAQVQQYEASFRAATPNPHPVFELALRWLYANLPAVDERRFVHGDFRLGNFMFDPTGLRGVLDWELAHWGDPMEDIGWLSVRSWRFGGKKSVAGICDRERFWELYEEEGGIPVDRQRAHFWEIFGNLKWGVITITQAGNYLGGAQKNVEYASIGRRTAETEIELLSLLEAEDA